MKESDFINQNKAKWLEVEKNLTKAEVSPSDTSKLFVQVTDDLSYARTFYKNRSVSFRFRYKHICNLRLQASKTNHSLNCNQVY